MRFIKHLLMLLVDFKLSIEEITNVELGRQMKL